MSSFVQRCLVILAGCVLPHVVYAMPCPTPSVPNVAVDTSAFLFANDCSEIERGRLLPSGVSGQILLEGNGSVTWVVNVVDPADTPLPYGIEFGYVLEAGQRLLNVFVNDVLVKPKLEFPSSGSTVLRSFTDPLIVNLRPGHNRIQLAATGQPSPFLETFNLSPVRYINRGENVVARPNPFQPECQRTGPNTFDFKAEPGYFDSYYGKVDPSCQRSTLDDWKGANNFLDFPHLVVHAEYINAYDLGFGRDMNCLDNGRTSCYVANHLDPKGKNEFAATVTMERMPFSSRTITAFFVYDALGKRINQIALDSEGAKSVPESCYACHRGYTHAGEPFGGEYLPFDIDAFEDWPGKLTRANQASAFRELNKIIHTYASQSNQNPDTVDLIESWYDGNVASGSYQAFRDFFDCNPSPNKLPKADWFTNKYKSFCEVPQNDINAINTFVREWDLYQFGYAKYCRMCHVAQAGLAETGFPQTVGNWPQSIVGPSAGVFDRSPGWARLHVCQVAYPRMPHAELTDERVRTDAFPSHGTEPIRPYNVICDPYP
jgi:hypothetical protein